MFFLNISNGFVVFVMINGCFVKRLNRIFDNVVVNIIFEIFIYVLVFLFNKLLKVIVGVR